MFHWFRSHFEGGPIMHRAWVAVAGVALGTCVLTHASLAPAEIDSGTLHYRQVEFIFTDANSTRFAVLYIFNQNMGSYLAGHEYYFINESAVSLLSHYSLSITSSDS